MAQLLLDSGADPNAINSRNNTPLHVAHTFDVMKVIASKTDINTTDQDGSTMLLKMLNTKSGSSKYEISHPLQLLDLGPDVHIVDNEGNSVLHYLATHEQMTSPEGQQMLERLIQGGFNPNLRNKQGQTALHKLVSKCCRLGKPSVTTLRTFNELTKSDLNAVDDKGQTPLFSTLDKFRAMREPIGDEFIHFMAEVGARFDVTDKRGRTLLHPAVRNCCGRQSQADLDVLCLLIELGADPQGTDIEGNTAWHEAVPKFSYWSLSLQCLQKITALGMDPKKANMEGRTPFHIACEYNQRNLSKNKLFEYLLEQVGDIDVKDFNGATALHTTATYSSEFTLRLLEAGADAALVTNEGLNVFHLAARCRGSNVIGLLLEWLTANTNNEEIQRLVNLKDKRGRAPLYYACAAGSYQSVELLISAGAVVEMETYDGSALNGCVDYVQEEASWRRSSDADSGGVFIDDARRPSYIGGRIETTLDLVIGNAAAPNWRLLDMAVAAAVEVATTTELQFAEQRQSATHPDHDITVECLMRARKSLGVENELPCAAEAQLCLERRQRRIFEIWDSTSKCSLHDDRTHFLARLSRLMISHFYDDLPDYINENSPEVKDLYRFLADLAKRGFARLLDIILTPETTSTLQERSETSIASLVRVACESEEPNMPVIRVLLSKVVRLESVKESEGSFLHVLSRGGHHPWWHIGQALPYLLKQGVNLEVRDKDGLTPLNASLENMEKPEWSGRATEMLLQAGADPSSVDDTGNSCLSRAVDKKRLFKLLVQHGATADHPELRAAILAKDVDLAELILASGVDPNGRPTPSSDNVKVRLDLRMCTFYPSDELYPLNLVISIIRRRDGDTEVCMQMVELLLKFGADPNARFHHTTIAHRTLEQKVYNPITGREERSNFIDIILQHPSLDVDLRNTAGVPLLHVAVKVGDEMAIRTLIKRGADVRSTDNLGQNVLHLSSSVLYSKSLFDDIVALAPELLRQADNDGKTPLHSAMGSRDQYGRLGNVREGAETFIEMLIAAGADTCAKSENGDTPLHLLFLSPWILSVDEDDVEVWQGPVKIIMDLLLSNGADINARNEAGETPIFTYLREGDFKVEITRAYFNKHNPDLVPRHSFQSSEPWSAIERRFAVEKESMLWALLEKAGVDWTAVDARGQFLLHIVAGREVYAYSRTREDPISPRVVRFRFLMGKGLDPLAEDGYHRTALDVAAVNSADDILELFKAE
jgi:ankyrin repeat protein